ncbi:hypothetical protein ACFL6W_07755 [Thermodesulfobacteriota bacterium]
MTGLKRERKGKNIRREINMLKEQFRSIELKPCYGDADIKRKEEDLSSLRKEIYILEKEIDQFAFPIFFKCK